MSKKQLVKTDGHNQLDQPNTKALQLKKKQFNSGVRVTSEISFLREVIAHHPGIETERVIDNQTFGSAMYLERAQKEHQLFIKILRQHGTKVHYLQDLLLEALSAADPNVRQDFIKNFLLESGIKSVSTFEACLNFFRSLDSLVDVIKVMFGGIKVSDVPPITPQRFADIHVSNSPFLIKPLSFSLYPHKFFNTLGTGVALFVTNDSELKRHSLVYEYIMRFHPRFDGVKLYTNRDFKNCLINSSDIIQISNEILLIGISHDTDVLGIESLARNLLSDHTNPIKQIIAINIHKFGAKTNLNELIAMVDVDKFIIARKVLQATEIFELTATAQRDVDGLAQIKFKPLKFNFGEIIEAIIDKQPRFVIIGGGDEVAERKELLDCGMGVLNLSPGEIVVFDRNHYTNNLLNELGLIIHKIPASELSRGPSGPLEMVCSLWRE